MFRSKSKPAAVKPVPAAPVAVKHLRKAHEFTGREVEAARLTLQTRRGHAVTGDDARAWLAEPAHQRPLSAGPR